MAYIFRQDELPRLLSEVPGRERTFFVSKELTNMDDMLAGRVSVHDGCAAIDAKMSEALARNQPMP